MAVSTAVRIASEGSNTMSRKSSCTGVEVSTTNRGVNVDHCCTPSRASVARIA